MSTELAAHFFVDFATFAGLARSRLSGPRAKNKTHVLIYIPSFRKFIHHRKFQIVSEMVTLGHISDWYCNHWSASLDAGSMHGHGKAGCPSRCQNVAIRRRARII